MKDETILKCGSLIAGLAIVETALILGVDGAALALGSALLGVGTGYTIKSIRNGKVE